MGRSVKTLIWSGISLFFLPSAIFKSLYTKFMNWPDERYMILHHTAPSKIVVKVMFSFVWIIFPLQCKHLTVLLELVENNPHEKIMIVGNHLNCGGVQILVLFLSHLVLTVSLQFKGFDLIFTIWHIYLKTGIYVRAIGDICHFQLPVWSQFLRIWVGSVKGTVENVTLLMETGQSILLIPGGADEIWKDERIPPYTLLWKNRAGFARLSIQYAYKIVPYGIVGFEDMVDIAFSIPAAPFWTFLGDKRALRNHQPPRELHPTSIAHDLEMRIPVYYPWIRLEKSYLVFGEAVDAGEYSGELVYELRNA
ncbi:hypothetical protein HK100_012447, partial [Physocladia obscura]